MRSTFLIALPINQMFNIPCLSIWHESLKKSLRRLDLINNAHTLNQQTADCKCKLLLINIKHYMRYDFKHWRVQMTMDWPNTQACIKSMGESIQLSMTVGLKVNTQPYVDTKASLSYFLNTLMSQWVAAAEW